ncbi:bifunctional 2-C-methyl-D-erythritol 4-phosphate cytidylyltransferase/2-C-methyl-D-erythritol 2,4-cyclodiphosphate synthase [Ahrensia marina]|uniref:bifunctional 2-C-methyl-D-erythritol 4-phosphate cytidylyltransferase/2-C-methyl-D-erythritol 2,4-cyclodiphosphate synthase n=1 Tax=Ahrensia marina TaxID=1514904 RepID=UPI001917A6D7
MQQSVGLVIVAAGRGERAGAQHGPKQYRELGAGTVIEQTLSRFSDFIPATNTSIVIHADDAALLKQATANIDTSQMTIVTGGVTRQESVHAGLQALYEAAPHITHVLIHDAARPFVNDDLMFRILEELGANPEDGVLPTIAVSETLKTVSDGIVTGTASRKDMHRAQTPQAFPFGTILNLHDKAKSQSISDFTDDAALFEWAGMTVRIVEGEAANIKLTYPQDFNGQAPMNNNSVPDIRTGNGYDVHRFEEGDKVILCGVEIEFHKKLSGHSDADVGLHALTDALLATCGAGDIGDHFPPSDEKWRGMASHIFLSEAVKIVRQNGGTIMNADVTLVTEAPKIAPYRMAMREKLSELLGISLERCSVKATTNEKMGFIGREEGIMALATASIAYGEKS